LYERNWFSFVCSVKPGWWVLFWGVESVCDWDETLTLTYSFIIPSPPFPPDQWFST
jgi:hypothetical protein